MKKVAGFLLCVFLVGLVSGCERPPKSGKGFVFPEGDAARGRAAFVELKCYTCHSVDRENEIPSPIVEPAAVIRLGGGVTQMRTYGDLVTSIIHPSYAISDQITGPKWGKMRESPMPAPDETMSVRQMLDIVTFLQPHYRDLQPLYYDQYYTP